MVKSTQLFLLLVLFLTPKLFAYDQELANRLKQDLLHESNRKRAFKQHEDERRRTDKEQNKGLTLWLEEQEKWDLAREKAKFEFKRNTRPTPQEGSKEYFDDLAEKERDLRVIEDGRKQHIQIKKSITAQFQGQVSLSEEEELGIYNERPRYNLRKRARNKWAKSGSNYGAGGSSGATGGYGGGGYQPSDNYDFPPPPPPDIPQDNFDDFPPPPPATDFANPGTFDSGFGDAPMPPPPPPPPPDGWDF